MGKRRGALSGFLNLLRAFAKRVAVGQARFDFIAVANDDSQEIIEVMGDSA